MDVAKELRKLASLKDELPQRLVANLELRGSAGRGKVTVEADEREIVNRLLRVRRAEIASVVAHQTGKVNLFLSIGTKSKKLLVGLEGVVGWPQQTVICEGNGEMNAVNKIKGVEVVNSLFSLELTIMI